MKEREPYPIPGVKRSARTVVKQKQCFRAVSDDSSIGTVQCSFHMRQHCYNAQPSDRKKKNWAVNRNRSERGASPSSPFMIGGPWSRTPGLENV